MPTDGEATLVLGQRARVEMRNTSGVDVLRLSDLEKFSFELVDLDQGARVIPLSKEPFSVSSYRNSAGDELPRKFNGKLCGWTGEVIQLGNTRVRDRGPFMLTPDPSPPAVFDTRTLAATADFAGLYGRHAGELAIKVHNEAFRLHGLFYKFARALQGFPDFAALQPTLVLPEAHMSAEPTEAAWKGLPDSLANNCAAVYTCRFFPSSMGKGISHYTFVIRCQGAVRLYVDGKKTLEHISHDGVSVNESQQPLTLKAGSPHEIRIEYLHHTGPAALTVSAKVKTEPFYNGVLQLDPDQPGFAGLNDAWVPD